MKSRALPALSALPAAPGVYSIFCHANKKFYVGGAVNIRARVQGHYRALFSGRHKNAHLQSAWKKYGVGTFEAEVLERCTVGNVKAREQAWLDSVKEIRTPVFNKYMSASGREKGFQCSAAVRAKQLGRPLSPTHRASIAAAVRRNPPNLGKTHSLESRAKMSAAAKGRYLSPDHRAKISASLRGNTNSLGQVPSLESRVKRSVAMRGRPSHNLGKKLSLETRAKISVGMRGKRRSIETRAKMSAAQRGKTIPYETRAKIASKLRGRITPVEIRAKMSDSHRRRVADPYERAKMSIAMREWWKRRKTT
jgi:group I intron endonuclease